MTSALLWFTRDLRLDDHQALKAALATHERVLFLYILDETMSAEVAPGAASMWWISKSLTALKADLEARGAGLLVLKGDPLLIIPSLMVKYGLQALYAHKAYGPHVESQQETLADILETQNKEAHFFKGHLLFEPFDLKTGSGTPYQVFTSFYKAVLVRSLDCGSPRFARDDGKKKRHCEEPIGDPAIHEQHMLSYEVQPLFDAPPTLPGIVFDEASFIFETPFWADEFEQTWHVGEKAARRAFKDFCGSLLNNYQEGRDFLEQKGFSKMSPYYAHGEIAVARVWHILAKIGTPQAAAYQRQLMWREFAYYLLHHFPKMALENMQGKFDDFPWLYDEKALRAFYMGATGCDVVDAAMRELWRTGFMANRARLIVGSYLCKNMLHHWKWGERWFYNTLVDADYVVNVMNWQWVAGTGVDAAPYFRIFNPELQQQKFDPQGHYRQKWLTPLMHVPFGMSDARPSTEALSHSEARDRALEALKRLQKQGPDF